jgi:hypothetical protein
MGSNNIYSPGVPEAIAPVLVLGVRRSGTTLLRVMLDRSSVLAIPDESYFVPQLAHRHPGRVDPAAFLDDVRRLQTVREWGITPALLRERLRPGLTAGEAIGAIFETYAALQGKQRWGDKTPLYMQYLPLLERLFPTACFVHLVRDGRDAALSYLAMPQGIVTEGWATPRDVAGFACQWRTEVEAARALGGRVGPGRYLEIRYEGLVADPAETLSRVCAFAGLEFEPAMVDYAGTLDLSAKPHQQRLAQPPTVGVRDWRSELSPDDQLGFERIAGALLAELGYEVRHPDADGAGARLRLAGYRGRIAAWRGAGYAMQRSPLWRSRHPLVS